MDKKKSKRNDYPDIELNNFQTVKSIINQGPSKEDPDGMYTGKPVNCFEVPVQDSDDL